MAGQVGVQFLGQGLADSVGWEQVGSVDRCKGRRDVGDMDMGDIAGTVGIGQVWVGDRRYHSVGWQGWE